MRILDQYGKPINTGPDFGAMSEWMLRHVADTFQKLAQPTKFETMEKLSFLRKSCGVEPEQKTIKFRRYPGIIKEQPCADQKQKP